MGGFLGPGCSVHPCVVALVCFMSAVSTHIGGFVAKLASHTRWVLSLGLDCVNKYQQVFVQCNLFNSNEHHFSMKQSKVQELQLPISHATLFARQPDGDGAALWRP